MRCACAVLPHIVGERPQRSKLSKTRRLGLAKLSAPPLFLAPDSIGLFMDMNVPKGGPCHVTVREQPGGRQHSVNGAISLAHPHGAKIHGHKEQIAKPAQ